jgi:hypothetical protein
MTRFGPIRTTIAVCPTCGRDVRDPKHTTSSHQNDESIEVEYIRADCYQAVIIALGDLLDVLDDGSISPDDTTWSVIMRARGKRSEKGG